MKTAKSIKASEMTSTMFKRLTNKISRRGRNLASEWIEEYLLKTSNPYKMWKCANENILIFSLIQNLKNQVSAEMENEEDNGKASWNTEEEKHVEYINRMTNILYKSMHNYLSEFRLPIQK